MAFGKKKNKDEGLDVLTEIKEPFSLANFFEEHVVERYKKIRKFLEEKGILFFLLSPFQQRNRLILQLAVIVFGMLLGIVPRSMNLLDAAKARNAASEMAALIDKNTQIVSGSITVRPLMSSQYKKQHLLAFYIDSNTGDAVPSTSERFEVKLSAARGVTDGEHVKYAYDVVPISEEGRLLLVYTDNRKQNDSTGIYNLTVKVSGEETGPEGLTPMEVVLSNTQETNQLFGESGIDLAVLTEPVLNDPNVPIETAQEAFDSAMSDYEMETERIASLPLNMQAVPTLTELQVFCKESLLYEGLTDKATTADVANMAEVPAEEAVLAPQYEASIDMGGVLYNQEYLDNLKEQNQTAAEAPAVTEGDAEEAETMAEDMLPGTGDSILEEAALSGILSEEEETVFKELDSLQGKVDDVLSALSGLNSATQTKYQTLKDYKLTLNQTIGLDDFSKDYTCGGVAD